MALEPSLQLALLIMPTMIILGWMTGQYISLEFDICELILSKMSPEIISPMLNAMINSGSGCTISIRTHFFSVYTGWQI